MTYLRQSFQILRVVSAKIVCRIVFILLSYFSFGSTLDNARRLIDFLTCRSSFCVKWVLAIVIKVEVENLLLL